MTESDKKKIKLYQNKISQMELDLAKFHSLLKRQFTSSNCNYYYDKITCCEYQISVLKDLIREIKLKRFNEQKKSQNLDLQG